MPIQLVGRYCAACGNKIVADPDGRICPRCKKPFHLACVTKSTTCPDCGVDLETGTGYGVQFSPPTADPYASEFGPPQRPISVTLIGWFISVVGAILPISLIMTLADPIAQESMSKSPVPLQVQIVLFFIACPVLFVAGIGILDGNNRARWLYIGWTGFSILFAFATSPMKLLIVPGLLVYLVITALLLSAKSNEFFGRSHWNLFEAIV